MSQSLVSFSWTPEAMERAVRDCRRSWVLLGRLADLSTNQTERDACLTTIAHLKLLVIKLEAAWESQIGLGEG